MLSNFFAFVPGASLFGSLLLTALSISFLLMGYILFLRTALLVLTVHNNSMNPTLHDGDRVLVMRYWCYRLTKRLRKGQIIIINPIIDVAGSMRSDKLSQVSNLYIKRIVALPDEIYKTALTELPEHARQRESEYHNHQGYRTWSIPAKHVFVRGDNIAHSADSLSWGPQPLQNIRGVVIKTLPYREDHKASKTIDRTPASYYIGLQPGQAAPTFNATTLAGEPVTLTSYIHTKRATAFLFISPSEPCRSVILAWDAFASQLDRTSVEMILVSRANALRTHTFFKELHCSLPILVAPMESNPFLHDYNVSFVPAYCLIDEQGMVVTAGHANLQTQDWQEHMDALVQKDIHIAGERR